jgi:hypothetical protein
MIMPIVHVNAKGKIYYLHQGNTKTGKPKYHFAMKSEGNLAESIPEGFEIYENPNAQVFLRRIPPKIITDEERQIVEDGMRKYGSVQDYKIDVKGKAIFVYTAVQDIDALMAIIQDGPTSQDEKTRVMATLRQEIQYTSDMQFVLVDEAKRTFATQRYCYLGSVDDWIPVGPSGKLPNLVKRYVKHLGKESFVTLG